MKKTQLKRRTRLVTHAPRAPQCSTAREMASVEAGGLLAPLRSRGWLYGACAGVALAGVVGTSVLAFSDEAPTSVKTTDAQGRPQKIGAAGLKLIEEFEGLELTGYVLGDGKCTIGYGHAIPIEEKPAAACKAWTITNAQAEEFLKEDTERFADGINEYFTRSFNQNQFDALMSFSYNVGQAYQKYEWPKDAPDTYFPGVMIQYVNPAQFREGLTRRRQAEIALFQNPSEPEVATSIANSPAVEPTIDAPAVPVPVETPAPEEPIAEVPAAPAVEPVEPAVQLPTVVVTQFPEITPLFSGGLSARN